MSKIEWTEETWNPVTGCTRVSAGCDNCYAARMSKRLEGMGQEKYTGINGRGHFNGVVKCHEGELLKPNRWRKPRTVFVCSMSDLFHPEVPKDFIIRVFASMALNGRHTFQVLTKRPERMAEFLNDDYNRNSIQTTVYVNSYRGFSVHPVNGPRRPDNPSDIAWPLNNVWLGTSAEDQQAADERIPHLLKCPAALRFLSCEPLLGEVDLENLPGYSGAGRCLNALGPSVEGADLPHSIDWVIAGGESGPNARPMQPDWARSLRDQCVTAGVPYFFKQWGEYIHLSQMRALSPWNHDLEPGDFGTMSGVPVILRESNGWGKRATGDLTPKKLQANENGLVRIGKNKAGRLLEGKEWNQMPERKEVTHG